MTFVTHHRSRRNRNRSKRRAIFCPIHGCYLDSVSQKHPLYADSIAQLRQRGFTHKTASLIMSDRTVVSLQGEWLEAFWCPHCQAKQWSHVRKQESRYLVSVAPTELWQKAAGLINPEGNPSVSEYTQRYASQNHLKSAKFRL
ncbi:MAG: hypothetical protein RLZZ568_2309 [Cyanobacteriota bacterium]